MAHSPHGSRIVIAVQRAERDQPENAIQALNRRGARINLSTCGPKKRLGVPVEEAEGTFGDRKIGETYIIAKGY